MGIIRLTLIATALTWVMGLLVGYEAGSSKHKKLLIEVQAAAIKQVEIEREKQEEYRVLSKQYYQDFIAASEREPIVERVYVKATCPSLPVNSGGGVGDAGNEARAELHAETVRRITAVTQQAETDVLKCKAQLASLQQKIKLFNGR